MKEDEGYGLHISPRQQLRTANKQTNKQASQQARAQTNKQASKQASKLINTYKKTNMYTKLSNWHTCAYLWCGWRNLHAPPVWVLLPICMTYFSVMYRRLGSLGHGALMCTQYLYIRKSYLSNSKTFQDGNGSGNFWKINSNDFQDGTWESMEMKGWLRTPTR